MRAVSFRGRVAGAVAVAVAVAVALAALVAYGFVRRDLRDGLDDELRVDAEIIETREFPVPAAQQVGGALTPLLEGRYLQVLRPDGATVRVLGDESLPTAGVDGDPPPGGALHDVTTDDGDHVRVITTRSRDGTVVLSGRSLEPIDAALRRLSLSLLVVVLGGVAVAVLLGRLVAATVVRPIHALSEAADTVARTRDPDHPIEVRGDDEVGRLAASFNTMLAELGASLRRQRRLTADVSHELRTPVSSIRTNVEVLRSHPHLDHDECAAILDETVTELDELTVLISDLVEIDRDRESGPPAGSVDLRGAAQRAVTRVAARHPDHRIVVEGASSVVRGDPERVERAIANLVDNACKWNDRDLPIEVAIGPRSVSVRDHGPGVDPEDAGLIFDRFYRSAASRGLPGSGLGLAIVKQIADDHAATVLVDEPEGGGARFTLRFASAAAGPGVA